MMLDKFLESIAGSMERMAEAAECQAEAVEKQSAATVEMCNAARDSHKSKHDPGETEAYKKLAYRYAAELQRLRVTASAADRTSIDAVLHAD